MAATPSTMLDLGTSAPSFTLPDPNGNMHSLSEISGKKGTIVIFMCNHCPFVIHVIKEIASIANDFKEAGISTVAISSNDIIGYPQDAPPYMSEFVKEYDITFPYLFDESQEVAKSYKAACTPDFFFFDSELKLVYRGQLDNSRPGNGLPVDGNDLRNAINNLLSGESISDLQKPSVGCNIKWALGNEPSYFG